MVNGLLRKKQKEVAPPPRQRIHPEKKAPRTRLSARKYYGRIRKSAPGTRKIRILTRSSGERSRPETRRCWPSTTTRQLLPMTKDWPPTLNSRLYGQIRVEHCSHAALNGITRAKRIQARQTSRQELRQPAKAFRLLRQELNRPTPPNKRGTI